MKTTVLCYYYLFFIFQIWQNIIIWMLPQFKCDCHFCMALTQIVYLWTSLILITVLWLQVWRNMMSHFSFLNWWNEKEEKEEEENMYTVNTHFLKKNFAKMCEYLLWFFLLFSMEQTEIVIYCIAFQWWQNVDRTHKLLLHMCATVINLVFYKPIGM